MIIRDRERDVYVYEERKKGRTFTSIASDLGVTSNRVRQIYCRIDWEINREKCDSWRRRFEKHPEDEELWTAHVEHVYGKRKPED